MRLPVIRRSIVVLLPAAALALAILLRTPAPTPEADPIAAPALHSPGPAPQAPAEARLRFGDAPALRSTGSDSYSVSSPGVTSSFSPRDIRVEAPQGRLSFRVGDIRLGGWSLPAGPETPPARSTDGAVHYRRGPVLEAYRPVDTGVEQSFLFDRSLEEQRGGGDLSIGVILDSNLPLRLNRDCVEAVDAHGAAVLSYGSAVAIDAEGRRRDLAYALDGSVLTMTLPADFLASAAFPLLVDPTIGVSPSTIIFNAPVGGPNPPPRKVTISNVGTGNLNWTAADNATWLSVAPGAGKLRAGRSRKLNLVVDVTGLAAGVYNATLTISGNATNSPQTVAVTLYVNSQPTIQLDPPSLTISSPVGAPNPPPQLLTLTNVGFGPLAWTATDDAAWLSVLPASGTLLSGAAAPLDVVVDVAGLAAGSYPATITITAPGASNTPQTLPVTLNVTTSPVIGLSTAALTFSGPSGGPNPLPQTVTVSNLGGGTLAWTGSDNGAWLSIAPASGSLGSGASQPMTVSVDVTGLAIGTYTATITVTDGAATNSPQTIDVTLDVDTDPTISLLPPSLVFDAPLGGPNPPPQTVTINNAGGGSLDWTGADNAAWLSAAPSGGSLSSGSSQPLTVGVDVTGLAAGSYSAIVTISDPNATNPAETVSVVLNVNASPSILVAPDALTFAAPVGGPNPSPETFDLSNVGGGTLSWTATEAASWLSVTPASGAIPGGGSTTISASVDVTGLAAGVYTANISVSDPAANNSPQLVSVTLTVSSQPLVGLGLTDLVFNAPLGGPDPLPQAFDVGNAGGGTLDWTGTDSAAWLVLAPLSGSLSAGGTQPVTATVSVTGLPAATYTATITISAAGAGNSPRTVTVTLNVSATPVIGLAPADFTFNAPVGGPNPADQTMDVSNLGGAVLGWTAVDTAAWLTVAPGGGAVAAGGFQTATLSVDVTGLAGGIYTATITISSGTATNSPQIASVTLSVSSTPAIDLSPPTYVFNAPLGGPNPAGQTMTVGNNGGGTLSWTGSDDAAWLSLAPGAGSLGGGASEPVTLSVDVTGLAAGVYTGTVTVTAAGASNSPQTAPVTLNVVSVPTIGLSPSGFTFAAPSGGPNPLDQALTISNVGAGTVTWTASDDAAWLTLLPTSGSATAGSPDSVTLSVDVSGLADGVHNATVTVTDPGAANSPQTLGVSLTVGTAVLPPSNGDYGAGYCGSVGLDLLLPLAILVLARKMVRRRATAAILIFAIAFGGASAWSQESPTPAPSPEAAPPPLQPAEDPPPTMDLRPHLGFILFSGDFEADPRPSAGAAFRISLPMVTRSILGTTGHDLGLVVDLTVSGIDRDVDTDEDTTGTLFFLSGLVDCVVWDDGSIRAAAQVGLQYGNFGGVFALDDGTAFLAGVDAGLDVGGGLTLGLAPRIAFGESGDYVAFVDLGLEFPF